MKKIITLSLILLYFASFSQNVGINGSGAAPNASAMLDVASTTSGILIPRMISAQRTAIVAPATGLRVYDLTTNGFWFFNGTIWVSEVNTGNGWLLAGNTLAGTEFMGSINAQPVIFRTNNTERCRITPTGLMVVGNAAPFAIDIFSAFATGSNYAVNGYAVSNGVGVYGENSGTGRGVWGTNSSTGVGVFGNNTSTGQGVTGNNSSTGIGVYGLNTGAGTGVYAQNTSATTGRAIEAVNNSATNTDICIGAFHNGNGRAGNFNNSLATNIANTLFANNSSTQNNVACSAIWGQSSGVRGIVGSSSLANAASIGIFGQYGGGGNINAVGVFGFANSNAGFGYGVVGQGNLFGLYANGNIGGTGTKAFRIDHPTDPENKYLLHYSIESPEVLNLYRGTVVLDANGNAAIELPSYFHSININFSYQLSAIGAAMPQLFVSQEIINGVFKISGGVAGKKVSWMVTSERNDEWVKQNPTSKAVEVEKRGEEKGKYLRPELYNQPKEKGIFNNEAKMAPETKPQEIELQKNALPLIKNK